jgi:hypothetical protein
VRDDLFGLAEREMEVRLDLLERVLQIEDGFGHEPVKSTAQRRSGGMVSLASHAAKERRREERAREVRKKRMNRLDAIATTSPDARHSRPRLLVRLVSLEAGELDDSVVEDVEREDVREGVRFRELDERVVVQAEIARSYNNGGRKEESVGIEREEGRKSGGGTLVRIRKGKGRSGRGGGCEAGRKKAGGSIERRTFGRGGSVHSYGQER